MMTTVKSAYVSATEDVNQHDGPEHPSMFPDAILD